MASMNTIGFGATDAQRERVNRLMIEMDKARVVDTTPRWRYETTGNGLTVEIFNPQGESVAYMQDEEAGNCLDEIEKIEDDDLLEYYLGQYA